MKPSRKSSGAQSSTIQIACTKVKRLVQTALGESVIIVIAASLLGLVYTGSTGKGLFGPEPFPDRSANNDTITSTFLTGEEALILFRRGDALFIDARHSYDFELGHIKGAMNIPLQEFHNGHPLLASVPRNKLIVTYCDGEECNSSVELAREMYAAGYSNVRIFFGGWNEWRHHNLPQEP